MDLSGEKHYVIVSAVDASGAENMNWRVCIAVPVKDCLDKIDQGRNEIIISMRLVGVSMLLLCILMLYALYLSRDDPWFKASLQWFKMKEQPPSTQPVPAESAA